MEMPALRLKATKTSLYKLVNQYAPLPILKWTKFWKAFRSPDYYLEWQAEDGYAKAFFSTCCGKPMLSIEVRGEGHTFREVHKLSLEDLQARGMLETVKLPGET